MKHRDNSKTGTARAVRCVIGSLLGIGLLAFACVSCRTIPPLPPADLSQPGWKVRQGQAVWKPTSTRPELSGDLLFATNSNGDLFVQFSKTPFALATAQIENGRWRIEFGNGDYTSGGTGHPPARFGWFELPAALAGTELDRNWHFERTSTNNWKLWNPRTGESLEGYLWP